MGLAQEPSTRRQMKYEMDAARVFSFSKACCQNSKRSEETSISWLSLRASGQYGRRGSLNARQIGHEEASRRWGCSDQERRRGMVKRMTVAVEKSETEKNDKRERWRQRE